MKALRIAFALLLLVPAPFLFGRNGARLTREQTEWLEKAHRADRHGWICVHLEGAPGAIGFQHGYLLADEILDLRNVLAMYNEKTTGRDWSFFRDQSMKLFWPGVPAEYREEIDGIVSGVNSKLGEDRIDRADVVAMNSGIEMTESYLPWLDAKEHSDTVPRPRGDHCSAIAATGSWTKDGRIVMAHSCWTDYMTGQRWNILFDMVPENGFRILMDALPGLIHSGDDFFLNSAGLIVTETTITQFYGFDTAGVAEFVRARRAIQYSSSIDEWVAAMLERNNGGYANSWLIGDNKTGEIARLELGLRNHPLERTKDGCFTGANYPVDRKLIAEETTFDTTLMNSSPNARKVRWAELMSGYKGKIDLKAAMKFMGDHYDTWRQVVKPSALTLCGHYDLDSEGAPCWGTPPYAPGGAVQAKATDGTLAAEMKLRAVMGHPCGKPFNAAEFLEKHPEYGYQRGYLRDMPGRKWTLFRIDMQ